MMVSIAILSCIGFVLSIIVNFAEKNIFDSNIFLTTIAILSCWNICFPISMIIFGILLLMIIVAIKK